MRGIFKYDGPIFGTLSKIGDLVILNFLILVFSLPVVTAGAAITAGHFAALKLVRDESKVFSDFWRSFRENFKQATVIWLGILLALGLGVLGICLFRGQLTAVILSALILFVALVSLWVFPVLSKFVNSTVNTVRNAAVLCFRHLFRTIAMALAFVLLPALLLISFALLPAVLLLGLSFPVWLSAWLYNRVFLDMEQTVLDHQQ